jgi:hypothetical protein
MKKRGRTGDFTGSNRETASLLQISGRSEKRRRRENFLPGAKQDHECHSFTDQAGL